MFLGISSKRSKSKESDLRKKNIKKANART